MKPSLNLFYTCIALSINLAAMEGATAQTTDSVTPAWKACAATPRILHCRTRPFADASRERRRFDPTPFDSYRSQCTDCGTLASR